MAMDRVDFQIMGSEMQFVEIELDPRRGGGRRSRQHDVHGCRHRDGHRVRRRLAAREGGLFGKLLGAGKRLVTGESLFTTVYTNQAPDKQRVAFAAPYPGKILPMDLSELGGTLICQKDAFLCAARGVSLGIAFQQKLSVRLLRRRRLHHAKLDGDGLAFVHAGGTVVKRELKTGETLLIDTGCVVAYTPNVNFEIQYVGKVKTALFGGEGLFFAKVTGPGTVWLQSLPFSRLASRVFAAAPQRGGSRDEGSVLGGFGAGGLLGGVLAATTATERAAQCRTGRVFSAHDCLARRFLAGCRVLPAPAGDRAVVAAAADRRCAVGRARLLLLGCCGRQRARNARRLVAGGDAARVARLGRRARAAFECLRRSSSLGLPFR